MSIIEDDLKDVTDLKELEQGETKQKVKKKGEFDVTMFKNSIQFFTYLNKMQAQ